MKKLLFEVSIIRPLIITLLVFYHSFSIWGGYWSVFQCFTECVEYRWIVQLVQGFRIETIALIAGYVYAYQYIELNRKSSFWPFVKKKLKRLYLPCLFFGVIYYLMFYLNDSFSWVDFIFRVTNGAGHLWFLPMLCWCFIAMWIFAKYNPNKVLTLMVLSILSVLPIPSLFFGLNRAFHFLFYFYAGYQLWIYREVLFNKFGKLKYILLFTSVYVLLVVFREYVLALPWDAGLISKVIRLLTMSSLKYLMAIFGILALYLFVYRHTRNPEFKCYSFVIHLSSVCYGVYIFHQFILNYLYYYTSLPCQLGLLLPWVGFLVTLILSYLLTLLFLKFEWGKKLIG